LDIAEKCGLTAYDSSYLALAADSGIDLLTADEKILRAVKDKGLPALRLSEAAI
jgi:predicted nucleic acid-binding protein